MPRCRLVISILVLAAASPLIASEGAERPSAEYFWQAQVDLMQGDTARAIAHLEQAIAVTPEDAHGFPSNDHSRARAVAWIAPLHERRGEWTQALARWTEWPPSARSDCGFGNGGVRLSGIARCNFHLGRVDAALGALRAAILGGSASEATVALYAQLSAQSGRMEEARRSIAGLPLDGDALMHFHVSVAIGEAFAHGNPAELLEAVRPLEPEYTLAQWPGEMPLDPEWRLAGQLLSEMDEDYAAMLESAIAHGDDHAIVLAGLTGDGRLIPPLEECLRSSGGTDPRVRDALGRLRDAQP